LTNTSGRNNLAKPFRQIDNLTLTIMLNTLKKLGLFSVLGLLAISLTACEQTAEDTDTDETVDGEEVVEDGPIMVGSILPLTGDGAAYGIPMQQIAQIALDRLNENGGVDGRMVEFIWEDGKCNGKDAAAAAQKLINVDKVSVIYGGFCSSETLGASPIAEGAGVIMLSPGSSSPDVSTAGDFIFRNYPSDSAQGSIIATIATDTGLEKIGMITEENDYTIGIESAFVESFEGETITESYLPTDTDFKTQITKLKNEGVDGIFINPQTPAKSDLIMKQIQELGTEGIQLFANDVVLGHSEGLTQYATLVEGMIGAETTYNTDHEDFEYLVEQYTERTGEAEVPYLTYGSTSYDAIFLLADAFEAVGTDAAEIRDWLYDVDGWEGMSGSLTLDTNGDPMAGHVPQMVKDAETIPYEA
jgi:branched-chain amino acid transport system substrate-binding protein